MRCERIGPYTGNTRTERHFSCFVMREKPFKELRITVLGERRFREPESGCVVYVPKNFGGVSYCAVRNFHKP